MSNKLEYSISGRFLKANLTVTCETENDRLKITAALKNNSLKLLGSRLDLKFLSEWKKVEQRFLFEKYEEIHSGDSKLKTWLATQDGFFFRKTIRGEIASEKVFRDPEEFVDPVFLLAKVFFDKEVPARICLLQENGIKQVDLSWNSEGENVFVFDSKDAEKVKKSWSAVFDRQRGKITYGEVDLGSLLGTISIELKEDTFFPML